jgi:hypothetical protein
MVFRTVGVQSRNGAETWFRQHTIPSRCPERTEAGGATAPFSDPIRKVADNYWNGRAKIWDVAACIVALFNEFGQRL